MPRSRKPAKLGASDHEGFRVARIALMTLHGQGLILKDYADDLRRQLAQRLGTAWEDVAFEPVYCQGILQPSMRAVWQRTLSGSQVRQQEWRTFILFGLADMVGLEARKELPGSTYEQTQLEIARKLLAARDQLGGNGPVVFLTHSLGCQMLSNYLYDAQCAPGQASAGIWRNIDAHALEIAGHPLSDDERAFLRGDTIACWVTTGCNIPVFVAADKHMRIRPIQAPNGHFHWLNLYDPDDPFSWPLQPLGAGYDTLVQDMRIKSTGCGPALTRRAEPMRPSDYWTDDDVLRVVSGALDELLAESALEVTARPGWAASAASSMRASASSVDTAPSDNHT